MILIDTIAAAATPPEAGLWREIETVIVEQGLQPVITALIPDMLTGEARLTDPPQGDYLAQVVQDASVEVGRG